MAEESEISVGEAINVIVRRLRDDPTGYQNYGYGVYLPQLWEDYVRERDGLPASEYHKAANRSRPLSAIFYAAAWELCRRGILRPGIREAGEQVTDDGQGGNGYSITPQGLDWLGEIDDLQFLPTEPGAIGKMLAEFSGRFGPGFHQRAQEAVKCYFATAYLGCCAMCGAAAESILLAVAVARTGDEAATLRTYRSATGRSRVENQLLGQAPQHIANRFRSFTDLLKYWRDETSHGVVTDASEIEAFDALGRLIRFCHFVDEHWEELTN